MHRRSKEKRTGQVGDSERFGQPIRLLDSELHSAITCSLLEPPEPGEKLKALLNRKPAWKLPNST